MKKDNKGFSLIELLIVLAIMGLLAGTTINVWYYFRQADVKQASKLIDTMLEYTRTNTMSINASWEMKIEKDITDDTYYVTVYRNGDLWRKNELGKRITVYTVKGSSETEITTSTPTSITFKMDTGGIKECGGVEAYRIKSGDKVVDVKLVSLTGAHYVESQ